jgi:hypothetical protein
LGIGPNPQSPIPNPQSPIPNPQSPFYIFKGKVYNKIIIFSKKIKFNELK